MLFFRSYKYTKVYICIVYAFLCLRILAPTYKQVVGGHFVRNKAGYKSLKNRLIARFIGKLLLYLREITDMIIGRKRELEQLKSDYESDEARLVAVYGRRRIGKTFLVRQAFDNSFFFTYSGAFGVSNKEQLRLFHDSLLRQGLKEETVPESWFDAFGQLRDLIEKSRQKRKVIFIDEMPWMDAPRSRFVPALEWFWNGWASGRNDILMIICGSASSWIIRKIFKNRGGLHNRVNTRIHLHPFSLAETEEFVNHHRLGLTRSQILEGYMVMGGVPFYWSKLKASKSLAQNINDLFINDDGELRYEFNELYASIFNNPERYISVIETLATKKKGLTRDEISKGAKIDDNGHLTTILQDLVECGFIRKYCHTDKKVRDAIYQLVDCYTLFYYQFVKMAAAMDEDYWIKIQQTPTFHTWCGLAFERVCLLHTCQIKAALGISGIIANVFSWHVRKTDEHTGVQIDLVIDRSDNVINICEMKYAPNGYTLTTQEGKKISERIRVFSLYAPKRKAVQLVMITSDGIVGRRPIQPVRELTASDLFS